MDMREFAEGLYNGINPVSVGVTAVGLIGTGITYFAGRKAEQSDEQDNTQNSDHDNERFL